MRLYQHHHYLARVLDDFTDSTSRFNISAAIKHPSPSNINGIETYYSGMMALFPRMKLRTRYAVDTRYDDDESVYLVALILMLYVRPR